MLPNYTQAFLMHVVRPEFLERADPARGSFRTFLLASLKNFLRDERKHRRALKRGGGHDVISLELEPRDLAPPAAGADPERVFLRAWAEQLLAAAVRELEQDLEQRGRLQVFAVFQAYCLGDREGVSYGTIAESLELTVPQVTNHLYEARRQLRAILAQHVAGTVCTPEQVDAELRALFSDA